MVSFVAACLCTKTRANRWALTAREESQKPVRQCWCTVCSEISTQIVWVISTLFPALYPPFFLGCCARGHLQGGFEVAGWVCCVSVNSSCSQHECWRFAEGMLLISCSQAVWSDGVKYKWWFWFPPCTPSRAFMGSVTWEGGISQIPFR